MYIDADDLFGDEGLDVVFEGIGVVDAFVVDEPVDIGSFRRIVEDRIDDPRFYFMR